jgi:hypothetical protein
MNRLDLEKFGVQELDSKEMENLEGGAIGPWIIGIGIYLYDNRDSAIKGFKDAVSLIL